MVLPQSQSQRFRTAINKTNSLSGMIGWTMYLVLVVIVALCGVHYSNSINNIRCQAGQYLTKDPDSEKEVCLVCEPGTYMSDEDHRKTSCEMCEEQPLSGSWKRVNRPCTWKSNTEIGCQDNAYKIHERSGVLSCKPCTICTSGQRETRPCWEYGNRVCSDITSRTGEDKKDRSEKSSSQSSSSSSTITETSTMAPEAITEATTTTTTATTPTTGNTPPEKGRSSIDAIPEQDAMTKCQCNCNCSNSTWVIVVTALLSGFCVFVCVKKNWWKFCICKETTQTYDLSRASNRDEK